MKIRTLNLDDPKQLWISFQAGDKEAFATIYENNIKLIYNYAKRYTKDEELIEDCIHNLFIYLWQNKHKLTLPLCIKSYLFCSIKRRVTKELIKQREICAQDWSEIENTRCAPELSVETNYIENQSKENLKESLQKAFKFLSGSQREAIELKYFNDLSCQEIAEIMETKPDNIYKLISRGLNILQKRFQKEAFLLILMALMPFLF